MNLLFFFKSTQMSTKNLLRGLTLFLIAPLIFQSCKNMTQDELKAPEAKRVAKVLQTHGDQRIDYYYWMNERDHPDVLAYIDAENQYLKKVMHATEPLQAELFDEMKNRVPGNDSSVPYLKNSYYYYTRYQEDKQYPLYCRKNSLQAEEELLLDQNILAEGLTYHAISYPQVSPNQQYITVGEDAVGRRIYIIKILDRLTKKTLHQLEIEGDGSLTWAPNSASLYYVRKDPETLRSYQVYRYDLATKQHKLTYTESDETFSLGLRLSKDARFLILTSNSTLTTECRYIDFQANSEELKIFSPRQKGHKYYIQNSENEWYIRSNMQADNYKLMKCTYQVTSLDSWKQVLPHRKDVFLEGFLIQKGYLVTQERYEGLPRLAYASLQNLDNQKYIPMSEAAYDVGLGVNFEDNSSWVRYEYSSMITPPSTMEFNLITEEIKTLKTQKVPDFDSRNYTSERLMAPATDGTLIPISLVGRSDVLEGKTPAPLLLYGYGSYGFSETADFNRNMIPLLNKGFVFAVAHIRGGQEMGRTWYEQGKLLNKKNTFTDFIACAEFLGSKKYVDRSRMFAFGGSAGGLLVGAVVNMRPDLFKGVIASVPFVDVVTTMLDESIPLTTGEYDEWGNPNDPTYYRYMKSYSPYDNVEAKDYPAMLVISGYHDSQVQYWEPTKWVAKLRHEKTDGNPLLLYTNMEAGHGGASGRYSYLKEVAMRHAFLLDLAELIDWTKYEKE